MSTASSRTRPTASCAACRKLRMMPCRGSGRGEQGRWLPGGGSDRCAPAGQSMSCRPAARQRRRCLLPHCPCSPRMAPNCAPAPAELAAQQRKPNSAPAGAPPPPQTPCTPSGTQPPAGPPWWCHRPPARQGQVVLGMRRAAVGAAKSGSRQRLRACHHMHAMAHARCSGRHPGAGMQQRPAPSTAHKHSAAFSPSTAQHAARPAPAASTTQRRPASTSASCARLMSTSVLAAGCTMSSVFMMVAPAPTKQASKRASTQ